MAFGARPSTHSARRYHRAGTGANAGERFPVPLEAFSIANDGTTDLVVLLDGVSHTLAGGSAANTGDVYSGTRLQAWEVVSGGAWRVVGEW